MDEKVDFDGHDMLPKLLVRVEPAFTKVNWCPRVVFKRILVKSCRPKVASSAFTPLANSSHQQPFRLRQQRPKNYQRDPNVLFHSPPPSLPGLPVCSRNPMPPRDPPPPSQTPLHIHTACHPLRRKYLHSPHNLPAANLQIAKRYAEYTVMEPFVTKVAEYGDR